MKEEEWCLVDVIFVEEVRNVPVGEVLKVDGPYAVVHFLHKTGDDGGKEDPKILEKSVIRRKDELQVRIHFRWATVDLITQFSSLKSMNYLGFIFIH